MLKKIIIIIMILTIYNVKANLLVEETDVYFVRRGGGKPYLSEKYEHYNIDGIIGYCIEPGIEVTTTEYKEMDKLPYKEEIIEKIKLIGYYGYNYPGHESEKYRMATQSLIWSLIGGQINEFYTKQYGYGEYINVENEKNDILKLVENHKIKPDFKTNYIEDYINEEITLEDLNSVLTNYEIESDGSNKVQINENKLIVKILTQKESKIVLKRKKYDNKISVFYEGSNKKSQMMAILTIDEQEKIEITVKPLIGQVELIKTPNKETNYSLEGAIYGIYNLNDELILTLKTNEEGKAESKISKGKYYLKEIHNPVGYELDQNKHYFEINKNNINCTINLIENIIESKITIHKLYGNSQKELFNEENTQFDIYQNNIKIKTITTDINGQATIYLPYGKYIIRQISTKKGYLKVPDIEVNITETKEINYELIDEEINAYIKIIKIDEETKEVIQKEGIKFKIKDLDTNEYICENEECTYQTNKEGYVITKEKLKGNLLIEEVKEKIDGYLWNNQTIEIFIGNEKVENDTYIIEFKNKRVKGKIEVLKLGEKEQIEDELTYKMEQLENVSIGLYAYSDIIINNKIFYKKNDLIKTLITNEEGKVIFDELELGKYYIKEIKTNENYILDENIYIIELLYIDEITNVVTKEITLNNYLKKSQLIINKIDSITKKGISETIFEIYKNNKLIYTEATNQNGQIIIDNLTTGQYTLIEKLASKGYKNNNEQIEFFIENEEKKEIYVENDFIIEVPNTMKNKNFNILPFFIFLIIGLKKYEKNN